MNIYLSIFLIGIIILIGAIIVNVIASILGLETWFSFINLIKNEGLKGAFKEITLISSIYLFLIYPFILGILGWLGSKLFV